MLVIVAGLVLLWLIARFVWLARGPLPSDARRYALHKAGLPPVAVAHIARGRPQAIILCHGLLKCMRDVRLLRLTRSLLEQWDVYLYDQPGHGASGGEASVDIPAVARIVTSLAQDARASGYQRVAAVGVSLGAAAAIHAAAQGAPVDAVVSISSPVSARWMRSSMWIPVLLRLLLRSLGTRLPRHLRITGWPLEVAADLSPCALLVVHCGRDTLVPLAASQALYEAARPPRAWLLDAHALHGTPNSVHAQIIEWLAHPASGGEPYCPSPRP
ncbi:MAG: alpha/beta fold hydrolase [Anaerolineae bacterium]|jgi:pimeloyl-ACP methyl ester carboxylesterase|nr:alpha/beta hydrolase [Chloroflexota bacterium]